MRDDLRMSRRTFVAASMVALAGCGRAESAAPERLGPHEVEANESEEAKVEGEHPSSGQAEGEAKAADTGKALVAFYSRAGENYANGDMEWLEVGHTKVMAGYIAEALGADTYEIVPAEAYPEGYDDCCDVAMAEQRADARPQIAGELPDVSAYGTVFIGCPIWWGDEPMIVRTFVEGVGLSGKTIVPFTTHGGSGLGSVPSNLKAAIPDASFLDGLAIAGTEVDDARDEVTAWAKGLALA